MSYPKHLLSIAWLVALVVAPGAAATVVAAGSPLPDVSRPSAVLTPEVRARLDAAIDARIGPATDPAAAVVIDIAGEEPYVHVAGGREFGEWTGPRAR